MTNTLLLDCDSAEIDLQSQLRRVAASYGRKLPGDFVLAAFSKDAKTFVLTEVVKSLSERQQAINLIHEYFMRTVDKPNREKLNGIWKVEAALIDLLADETPLPTKLFVCYQAMESLTGKDFYSREVKWTIKRDLHYKLLVELLQKLERPILLSELILEVPQNSKKTALEISPSLTQKFNSAVPLFAEKTEGMKLWFDANEDYLKELIRARLGYQYEWVTPEHKDSILKSLAPHFEEIASIQLKVKTLCERYPNLKANPNFSGGDMGDLFIYFEPTDKRIYGFGCKDNNDFNRAMYSVGFTN